jgi:hypothetical protein
MRLLASALLILSGAIAANARQLNVNVAIFLVFVGVVMFGVEYLRLVRSDD